MNTIDYIITEHGTGKAKDLQIIDNSQYIEYEKIEKALNKAFDNNTIEVYYQPLHNKQGRLIALEALCRIIDPEIGFLNPEIFIRIAERNGRIHELGDMVLRKTCEFIKKYQVDEWGLHHIGINLSFLQCARLDLYEKIESIIKDYSINKKVISFEITETESSSSIPIVDQNMKKLINEGYSFLLDDFGSGYANYNYIFELPFCCIKFDKSILWQAMNNEKDMVFLKSIIDALTKLGFTTVCEGVETIEQKELLDSFGITMHQGYYFSKALKEEDIFNYYQTRR